MTKFYIFGNIFLVIFSIIYVGNDTVGNMIQNELVYLLEKNGMTYPELAEKAGIPLETMRNLYYGKVKDPKVSTLLAISRVLNITVNRLMGERIYSKQEERLIMNYRRCGSHGKSMVMLTADYEAELARHERTADNKYTIPCIVPLEPVHDGLSYSSSEMVDISTDNPCAYIAIEITSNEFTPVFCKGDRILIEDRWPSNGESAVFFLNNMVYCRKFREHDSGYTLESLNRHGQDFEYKRMDKVKCIGTCVGVVRT